MTRLILLSVLAMGCRTVDLYPTTEVKLEIEGETYDYIAAEAQWEEEQGRTSVYLLPADRGTDQPYVNLRYYSGNPVAHFWLRYEGEAEEKGKWECFVPGTLMDGTETLDWPASHSWLDLILNKVFGRELPELEPRVRTETGEADCKVTVTHAEGAITLAWDVVLSQPKTGAGGHGGASEHQTAQEAKDARVSARGSATITL